MPVFSTRTAGGGALVLALCACTPPANELVTLPGFSIALPAGEVVQDSKTPSAGKYILKLPGPGAFGFRGDEIKGGRIVVEWSTNAATYEGFRTELMPTVVDAFTRTIPGTKLIREEKINETSWWFAVGGDAGAVTMGQVKCEDAFSINVTYARYRDVEQQVQALREVLASVRCAVTDANRSKPRAAARLPGKFGHVPDPDSQIFRSLDGEQLILTFTGGDLTQNPQVTRTVLHSLFRTLLGAEAKDMRFEPLPAPKSGQSLTRASFPASGEQIYVGARYCADASVTLLVIWTAPNSDEGVARERQEQVGCPGGVSSPTREFREIAGEACQAGDAGACEAMKETG